MVHAALNTSLSFAGSGTNAIQFAHGPALLSSFLQVPNKEVQLDQPEASPSPGVHETARILQAGGYSAPLRMQSLRPTSQASEIVRGDPNVASASVQLGGLSQGAMARKLLGTEAALAGIPGRSGSRRALQASPEVAVQSAGGVLGMLQALLPSEAHTGSAEAKHTLPNPPPVPVPSENMLYKDYIPGLVGQGDSPGFMSLADRLYKMLRLRAHDAAAPGGDGEAELPRAPATAFAGENIAQAQQELVHLQHVQHQQQGPLSDASGQVGVCPTLSTEADLWSTFTWDVRQQTSMMSCSTSFLAVFIVV